MITFVKQGIHMTIKKMTKENIEYRNAAPCADYLVGDSSTIEHRYDPKTHMKKTTAVFPVKGLEEKTQPQIGC